MQEGNTKTSSVLEAEIMAEGKKELKVCAIQNSEDLFKKYKKQRLLYFGNDLDVLKVPRCPTGVFRLDISLGGGIPEGRITGFHGAKSSSKSTTALRVANQYLKKHPEKKVLYVDFEGTYDPDWSNLYVEDNERILVLAPDYGEQGVNIIEEAANASDIGMIIIDSIAMMSPLGVLEKSAAEDTMGMLPKLVVKLLRKIVPVMAARKKEENLLTVIMINQLISNFDARYGDKSMTPGGRMKDFMFSLDIKFKFQKLYKINAVPALWEYNYKIIKNKGGLAQLEGEYQMLQVSVEGIGKKGDLIEGPDVFDYAKKFGLVERIGNKWKLYEESYNNQDLVKLAMKNDRELFERVKRETLEIGLIAYSREGGIDEGTPEVAAEMLSEDNPDNDPE